MICSALFDNRLGVHIGQKARVRHKWLEKRIDQPSDQGVHLRSVNQVASEAYQTSNQGVH
jgi:hypothetical protein